MESFWSKAQYGSCDPIIQVAIDYDSDPAKQKANLCIGVCYNDAEELHCFESVKEAEKIIQDKYKGHPYMLHNGTKEFSKLTQELIFGKDSVYMKEKRICTLQSVGGTGALYLTLIFLKKICEVENLYVTDIPYVNHVNMSKYWGYDVKYIRFYDSNLIGINYESFLEDLEQILPNSAIFIQPCCYNPCAVQIDEKYYDKIADIVKRKRIIVIFDVAYQGFGSGDVDTDVKLIRKFQEKGIIFLVCQSFSKNLSLYGERAAALHVVCKDTEERRRVARQCIVFIRYLYNFPTLHTNRIVVEVLGNEKLKTKWLKELYSLSELIKSRRVTFFDKLTAAQKKYGLNINWEPYKNQSGLFSFVPLFAKIYDALLKEHVYIVNSGRINISAITHNNIDFVVDRICKCLQDANIKS